MSHRTSPPWPALLLLCAWTLAPAPARAACEEEGEPEPEACPGVDAALSIDLRHPEVPSDGVLVLRFEQLGEVAEADLVAGLELTVTRDGEPVAGAVEPAGFPGAALWRPAAPLDPGAAYQALGSFTNPALPPELATCAPGSFAVELEFAAVAPAEPLAAPAVTAKAGVLAEDNLSLTTVVCCDGALPYDQVICGVPYGLSWAKGACAATEERRFVRVQLDVGVDAGPASAAQWVRELRQGDEVVARGLATTFVRELEAPACLVAVQRSLATGEERAAEPRCFGEGEALGVLPVDPAAALADRCNADLYTCEIDVEDMAWTQDCVTWDPDGQPTTTDATDAAGDDPPQTGAGGCGCATHGGAPWPALLLLLLSPSRRRRGSRARPAPLRGPSPPAPR